VIVVTGATGRYGRLVVEHLLRRGVPAGHIAAAVRTPAKAAGLAAQGVQIRHADYDRTATLASAFDGADKILLVSSTGPGHVRTAQHRAAIDAARTAGAGLLAYTSVTNAPDNPMGLAQVHRDTEQAIADSGLPAVLLRNGWYTENHTAALPRSLGRGTIVGSAGQGRMASATRSDLAEAAAVVLTLNNQAGRTYDLTGDTAWSMSELAAETAAQTGTPFTYTDLPAEQYRQILTQTGLPEPAIDLIVDADIHIARGALAHVTDDLSRLLGRLTTPLSSTITETLSA
jgi:NAD(P)H dehydrogenase (quinone)